MSRSLKAARQNRRAEARQGLELIFDLLHQIDGWKVNIIFFADEGGSYEVSIDWGTVLPVWFRCLAPETTPSEYSLAVHQAIEKFARHLEKPLLAAARRAGSREQRDELTGSLLPAGSERDRD